MVFVSLFTQKYNILQQHTFFVKSNLRIYTLIHKNCKVGADMRCLPQNSFVAVLAIGNILLDLYHYMENLVQELEYLVNKTCIKEYSEGRWNEDHISYLLVKGLQTILDGNEINYNHFKKKVSFKAYKQDGTMEEENGDIALLVNIRFSSGETLRGVAFLEAKRLYNSGHFDSIRVDQLENIRDNAPYSQLLQYYPCPNQFMVRFPDVTWFRSCMWVSPIQTACEMLRQMPVSRNESVIKVSLPLSQFIVGRILWGKDLDYRKNIYDEVLNAISEKIKPKFLCIVDTYYPNQQKLETIVGDRWIEITG